MQPSESVYVVVPASVYDHGIVGVFTTREAAEAHAEAFWRASDGYHRLRIEEWPLDVGSLERGPDRFLYGRTGPATTNEPHVEFKAWQAETPA